MITSDKNKTKDIFTVKYISELYIFDSEGNMVKKYDSTNAKFRRKNNKLDEDESILRIKKYLRWNIQRLRAIEIPESIRTPDIKRIINNKFEYWDIKNIGKSNTLKSKSRKISHAFDEAMNQAENIIIDINRKDCDLNNFEADSQILKILKTQQFISIKKIVLLGKNNYIKFYKR